MALSAAMMGREAARQHHWWLIISQVKRRLCLLLIAPDTVSEGLEEWAIMTSFWTGESDTKWPAIDDHSKWTITGHMKLTRLLWSFRVCQSDHWMTTGVQFAMGFHNPWCVYMKHWMMNWRDKLHGWPALHGTQPHCPVDSRRFAQDLCLMQLAVYSCVQATRCIALTSWWLLACQQQFSHWEANIPYPRTPQEHQSLQTISFPFHQTCGSFYTPLTNTSLYIQTLLTPCFNTVSRFSLNRYLRLFWMTVVKIVFLTFLYLSVLRCPSV